MLNYLKRCAASVHDQEVGGVEHIVIDGGSNDGSVEWLAGQEQIESISEKDHGMYDAINKGFKLARGEILAYLNCDEQYLPGTLSFVKEFFARNPGVDMIFGDVLLIKPDGNLVAFRKGYTPRWQYIVSSHLYVLSCTMFFRRKIYDRGIIFDSNMRAVGDADFVVRVLRDGYKARHLKRYLSAFTMTGENMSIDPKAIDERKQFQADAPRYIRMNKWLINGLRLTEKLFSGAYFQKMPLEYAVYTEDNQQQRKRFQVYKASFRWKF